VAVIFFFWQEGLSASAQQDAVFNLERAAIPCELVEGRPLTVAEAEATFGLGQTESCDIDNGASPAFDPDKNVWLAVVTSMFLHGSLLHLGGNMLFLWIFGNNVEDTFGKVGFTLFYMVGGVVATLTHVALNLDSTVPLVGASGAIAAVMGAYFVLFPRARVHTAVFMLLIAVVAIPARWVLGFWFVSQFFVNPNSGVAWAAHVGGFVFGVLVALLVRAIRTPRPAPTTWTTPGWQGWQRRRSPWDY
jgi:membrane associated rhomboid family serine protease